MKKISKIVFSLIIGFLFATSVEAASGTISVVSNTRLAIVGSTFKVSVTVSSTDVLGTWKFGLSYDSSYVAYQGGDALTVADYGDGKTKVSRTYTYTFKALKSGTARIGVQDASMVAWSDASNFIPVSAGATNVTVKTQAEIQASYSKDNFLKSLTVDEYELNPKFDKNTLEYSVSVPDTVEKINVKAVANDSRSRVTGAGTIDISEGANKIEIVVTAENGSIKTYTLNVDVKDLDPIEVTADGKTQTVVKKDTLLTEPIGFTKTTVKIKDVEVPAYKNDRANLVVVGLKDSAGKIGMYLYDEENGSYTPYNELKNSSIILFPIEIESVPEGFKKTEIEINGTSQEVMVSEYDDDFYLIYAMNIETGDKNYYQFDRETNNFLKYNAEVYKTLLKQNGDFKLFLIAFGGVATIFFLVTIIMATKNSKLKKIIRRVANNSKAPEISKQEAETKEDDVAVLEEVKEKKGKKKKR